MDKEDVVTLEAQDDDDELLIRFEEPNLTRISEFALKLMDIDSEQLGITETEADCHIRLPGQV